MNQSQHQFLIDLAASKGVKCVKTFSYCYELTFENGEKYEAPFYDCLKSLGHYGLVH